MRPFRLATSPIRFARAMIVPLFSALLAAQAPAQAPASGAIEIAVTNVENARGSVRVSVCTQATFLKDCRWNATVPARAGTTLVVVRNVPPGRYAVQAFHDSNNNGEVDRGLFGIPKEAVGFSNDAPIRFAPPSFADAAFDHGSGEQRITFRLRRF